MLDSIFKFFSLLEELLQGVFIVIIVFVLLIFIIAYFHKIESDSFETKSEKDLLPFKSESGNYYEKKPRTINSIKTGELTKNINTSEIYSSDINGEPFNITIYIFGEEFNWAYRSYNVIEMNKKKIDLSEYLSFERVKNRLSSSKDIIAVGLASQEGSYSHEEERAYLRARHLKLLLEKNIDSKAIFHKLTIGQHKITDTKVDRTDHQRPIIIIGIDKSSIQINLQEELKSVLKQSKQLPINLDDYKSFTLDDVRNIKYLQ